MDNDYYPDGASPKDYFYPIMVLLVIIAVFFSILNKS